MLVPHRLGCKSRCALGKTIIRWITYNLIFALLPLGASLTLHALSGTLTAQTLASSPEILFFCLMVSATALGDLSEITASVGWDLRLRVVWACLLFGAIWSAILYGALLSHTIPGPATPSFQSNLLKVSVGIAVPLFLVSTLAEVLIGRIKGTSVSPGVQP